MTTNDPDPVGDRAWDELMRVTGMGKYGRGPRPGPGEPRRASIPARRDYDTDLIIGEALRERTVLRAAVKAQRDWLLSILGKNDPPKCGFEVGACPWQEEHERLAALDAALRVSP